MGAIRRRGYYAVRIGRIPGIYDTWADCQTQTTGFRGAIFKRFGTREEAQAFVDNCALPPAPQKRKPIPPSSSSSSSSNSSEIIVYTDGASAGNGKQGARAGVGVFFGVDDARNVSEPLEGDKQTNQRAELTAVIRALDRVLECNSAERRVVRVHTDSMYSINCLTTWFQRWEENGWRGSSNKPVDNADLVKRALRRIRALGGRVRFVHVRGHAGIYGNEMADRLAVDGASR